jgi:hypothetical protein
MSGATSDREPPPIRAGPPVASTKSATSLR